MTPPLRCRLHFMLMLIITLIIITLPLLPDMMASLLLLPRFSLRLRRFIRFHHFFPFFLLSSLFSLTRLIHYHRPSFSPHLHSSPTTISITLIEEQELRQKIMLPYLLLLHVAMLSMDPETINKAFAWVRVRA